MVLDLMKKKPKVKVSKKKMGGLSIVSTVELTHIDEKTIHSILSEYGIHSADVVLREDVTIDTFIHAMEPNRANIPPMTIVVNKIDIATEEHLNNLKKKLPNALFVSADDGIMMDELKERIFVDF